MANQAVPFYCFIDSLFNWWHSYFPLLQLRCPILSLSHSLIISFSHPLSDSLSLKPPGLSKKTWEFALTFLDLNCFSEI